MLKSMYFYMSRAEELDEVLASVVDEYDAGALTSQHFEGCGLVVVGESHSGKTWEIDHALARMAEGGDLLECGREKRFTQFALNGETTWKAMGLQITKELGYEMSPRCTEHVIWSEIRKRLQQDGVWLLHIDECQHMFQTLGENETRKVLNSIKTFMKHRDWPIVVVLSGIPELMDKVNLDPQLRNLITPCFLPPLDPLAEDAFDEVDTVLCGFSQATGIGVSDVRNEDVYARLCHGHGNLYGRIFRFLMDVFAALPADQSELSVEFLADRYASRTGCVPCHNVFLGMTIWDAMSRFCWRELSWAVLELNEVIFGVVGHQTGRDRAKGLPPQEGDVRCVAWRGQFCGRSNLSVFVHERLLFTVF